MRDVLDKRFIVVAGKGGVGRTTVSAALGVCAARLGRRTLVCLNDAPPRYSEILGGGGLGSEPRRIFENLDVINLNPVAAREEYGLKVLHNQTLHRILFGSKVVNAFLDAVPGLAEWAMFGKATFHALNEVDGRPEYDLVVFDSPATGHGLDVLSLPEAIAASVPSGRIGEEAAQRVELLGDPQRCEILPTTIPEETPVNETFELLGALEKKGMPVRRILVNMVLDLQIPSNMKEIIEGAEGEDGLPRWAAPAAVEIYRRDSQKAAVERLAGGTELPIIELPFLGPGGLDEASLLRIVGALEDRLS